MVSSGFFNSSNGDRRYGAEDWASYFASFIGNGVFPNPSDGLQVMEDNAMHIQVMPGRAWIDGYFLDLETPEIIVLDNADGVITRIDRIVARLNMTERAVTLAVKKGVYSQNPVPQELERTATVYELALADVTVGASATAVTQADITDLRLETGLCGIVHGAMEQVDTTTIFNQFASWYDTFTEQSRNDFAVWFDTIKDILDEETAGNLLNLIMGKQDTITATGLLKGDGAGGVTAAVPGVDYLGGWNSQPFSLEQFVYSNNLDISYSNGLLRLKGDLNIDTLGGQGSHVSFTYPNINGSPLYAAYRNNRVVFGTSTGYVYMFDTVFGTLLWSNNDAAQESYVNSIIDVRIAPNGIVYALTYLARAYGSTYTQLYCYLYRLDQNTGERLWRIPILDGLLASTTSGQARGTIGCDNAGNVYCLYTYNTSGSFNYTSSYLKKYAPDGTAGFSIEGS